MNRLLPVLVVLAAAIYSIWPMVRCLNCVADYGKDGYLINWIINTAGKNLYGLHLGSNPGIFDGSIFYPYKHVMAYSELFFVTASWAYPAGRWLQNPADISGLALVAGQAATLLVIYLWWKKISGSRWGAAVATLAFGISQIRFEYQVHLQMWSMQYWLVGCWLVINWLEKRGDWKLFLGAGLIGLQVWESLLPVYFLVLIIGVKIFLTNYHLLLNRKIFIAAVLFGVIAAAPLLTYWGVGKEFNYQRSIRDAANNSLAVNDIWGEFTSPGLYLLLAMAVWRLRKSFGSSTTKWLFIVLASSLVIAFGPVVKWGTKTVKIGGRIPIPLPYAAMYYAIPGFGALRTPSRWIWVAGWAASGIIAIGFSNLRFTINNWEKNAALIGMLMFVIVGGKSIKYVQPLPNPADIPKVFMWLRKQPGEVMVILPMAEEEWEMERLPYALADNKKTLNGFSGFYPPPLIRLGKELTENYPNEKTTEELRSLGVSWVVVDKKMYNKKIDKIPIWEDKDYAAYRL